MSSSGNDPNAWLGLLKWSLAHQDGTRPSDASPMSDEDRAWLEKVVSEGVRDDVKAMTEIFARLCEYLDTCASVRHQRPRQRGAPGLREASSRPASENVPTLSMLPPAPPQEQAQGVGAGALSTYVVPPSPGPDAGVGQEAEAAPATTEESHREYGEASGSNVNDEARIEGVLNDLEELQDIVEQIDMAATFVKIGGFGRLIALVTPKYRPEKLRLRAASVIATLTKNNPPAQADFSTSGGHKALLEIAVTTSGGGSGTESLPPTVLSFALQRAILHALSCSVMGLTAGEDALCSEPKFQVFLAQALAQRGQTAEAEGGSSPAEAAKLRSKAAFVLKALVSAPGASVERSKALWPAVLGLLAGLETITSEGVGSGDGDDPAAARETCIEALIAAGRGGDGSRVVRELSSRVSTIMNRRRRALAEGRAGMSEEDAESADVELGLWLQWEGATGPPQ